MVSGISKITDLKRMMQENPPHDAATMESFLAVEGKFTEEGLRAMTQRDDMTNAMAKALTEGLEIEGGGQIWKKSTGQTPEQRNELG